MKQIVLQIRYSSCDSNQHDMDTGDLNSSNDLSSIVAHDREQQALNMLLTDNNVKTAAAKFILSLKKRFKLPQTLVSTL